MADEKVEESGSERSRKAARGVSDPEKGSTDVQTLMLEMADMSVSEVLLDIVKTIAVDLKLNKSIPNAKLLLDLAGRIEKGKVVTAEQVESLAEKLARDLAALSEVVV